MKKLANDDPRAQYKAADVALDRAALADHLCGRHQWVLATTRADGRPQMSLVTGGMIADGTLAIATYPTRAKAKNVRRNNQVSVAVMGDAFNAAWVQIDGEAQVLDMPEAAEALVEYFRCISGEHDDWDEYRQAMVDEGRLIARFNPSTVVGQVH